MMIQNFHITEKAGLILEGGGMRGVFTSGVLDNFMDRNIRFPYTVGVSAGACNAIAFVGKERGYFRKCVQCPFCSSENTRVIDSRPADDNSSIRRRRLCDDCGKRFTTYEKVETIPLIVIKKDNIREQYDRSKIEGGVLRACHKRPISADQITKLVDDVEVEIFNREDKEIPSTVIGEILMDKLKDLDSVAYVRFASVYREFKDVNTFMNELKKMLG